MDSHYGGKYLLLGDDEQKNWESIAQFSKKDAGRSSIGHLSDDVYYA
jgi:hypothetical protein